MDNTTKTAKRPKDRPLKPYAGFPLFAHRSGRWAKKIRGTTHYFGRWGNVQKGRVVWVDDVKASAKAAEELYVKQRDDLYAGRKPRVDDGSKTVADICNEFLRAKEVQRQVGNLSDRTFCDYHRTCALLIETFGRTRAVSDLRPADFGDLYKKLVSYGPHARTRFVNNVKSIFNFAHAEQLIPHEVKYGTQFVIASQEEFDRARAKQRADNGKMMFEAAEIRAMLDKASPQLKAMILLGVNCGFGNTDCAQLPLSVLDLERGWVDYPRPKTGVDRRCKLWPETVAALKAAISQRPTPKDEADGRLVFLTRCGVPWVRYSITEKNENGKDLVIGNPDDAISKEMTKLMKSLGIKRKRLSFYGLRHSLQTVGSGARDRDALMRMMGHKEAGMSRFYMEDFDDARLEAVANHVHAWLYPKKGRKPKAK